MSSLEQYVDSLRIIDSHEHIQSEDERIKMGSDPFKVFLSHYASSDLRSAGLTTEDYSKLRNEKVDIIERWKTIERFWRRSQNTSYFNSLNIIAKDLYDIEEINENTITTLAEAMKKATRKGFYNWVLKDRSKIDVAIVDNDFWDESYTYHYYVDVDKDFFAPVARFENFILPRGRDDIRKVGRMLGTSIHSLGDLERGMNVVFESLKGKIVGIKVVLAYFRTLNFEKVTFNEAERVFNKMMSSVETFSWIVNPAEGSGHTARDDRLSVEECKPLQDYMVHKLLQLAGKNSLPVQVHTGHMEGNLGLISNSHPTLLANLFVEYEDVVFDVFHGAYPYMNELASLAKTFPNVYIDMCFLHLLSPHSAREALDEWLDVVPASKILGFGGDYLFVEGAYSHAKIAKRNTSAVLRTRVDEGKLTEEQARAVAKMILRDNVLRVFSRLSMKA